MSHFRLGFTSLLLLLGAACVAPDQRFGIGSPLWLSANPELEGAPWIQATHQFEVLVGVLDGGFDYNIPRLRKHIQVFPTHKSTGRLYGVGLDVLGEDFFPHHRIIDERDGTDVSDDLMIDDHGTHVAQLVTLGDPRIGLVPVRVLPLGVRASDTEGLPDPSKRGKDPVYLARMAHRSVEAIATGVEFAVEHGASILNLSLGLGLDELLPADRAAVMAKVDRMITQRLQGDWSGSLLVVACGNESALLERADQTIPATLDAPHILSVGALKDSRNIAYFTNRGRYVDLYAVGTDIKSAVPGGKMEKMTGSSMAAPIVAHAAAQVKAIDPTLRPSQLRALLLNTADSMVLPFEGHEHGYKELPPPQPIRVLNIKAARDKARELLRQLPRERARWLTPPYLHGQAPVRH